MKSRKEGRPERVAVPAYATDHGVPEPDMPLAIVLNQTGCWNANTTVQTTEGDSAAE